MSKDFYYVALVGKLNQDISGDIPDYSRLDDTKYRACSPIRCELGGASANVSRAISLLSEIYGESSSSKIITRIGSEPKQCHYDRFEEYLAAKNAYHNVFELLRYYGTSYVDVSMREEGTGVAGALVVNYGGNVAGVSGRTIVTDPDADEIQPELGGLKTNGNSEDLKVSFNNAVHNLTSRVKPILEKELAGNDCIFVDPARPYLASVAAMVCREKKLPYVVDYGAKVWPKDSMKSELLSKVLRDADILIVPDDAVVKGMEDNVRNPDLLFEKLTNDEYRARTVIMSNSSKDVRVHHNGDEYSFAVEEPKRTINIKGVGDTRDGAFIFFLVRGDDVLTAIEKATAVATIRIQYSGDDWTKYFVKEVMGNERFLRLFDNDLYDLKGLCAQDVKPARDDEIVLNEAELS